MASSLLRSLNAPSEGLTLEFLCGKISSILLQPTIIGVGLLASIYCPGAALSLLPLPLQRTATNFQITASLACLVSAGLLFRLNCWLSNRALNHFTTDSTWDWEKEIALVTGGSSGIGALVVENLAKQNIKVVSIDINPPLKPLPKSVRFYQVDITSFQNIHSVSKKIKEEIGNPSILVNNAGIATASSIIQKSEHDVRRVFDVNIISHFALLKEFLPDMVKNNHGHIVTVASMASFMVHAGGVDYACSKTAALAFHEGLNQELRHMYKATGIRTTVVHPSWVRTPLIDTVLKNGQTNGLVLEVKTVADAIIAQILKCESAQLILPSRLTFMAGLRGYPSWLQEWIRSSGGDSLVFMCPEV